MMVFYTIGKFSGIIYSFAVALSDEKLLKLDAL